MAQETEILWRRELAGPAYHAAFVTADTAQGQIRALTFTADHASKAIVGNISRAEQVRYIATRTGSFGSSLAYLSNIVTHFAALGIEDAEVSGLMRETAAYLADRQSVPPAAGPSHRNGGK